MVRTFDELLVRAQLTNLPLSQLVILKTGVLDLQELYFNKHMRPTGRAKHIKSYSVVSQSREPTKR
jgi:hypothetical protein